MRMFRPRTKLAALAASSALLLTGCDFSVYDLPLPGGADVGDDAYRVTVQFRDVLDLVPQSNVKVDDVTVGMVEDVRLDGYTAEVSLLLRKDVKLPDNAEAQIRQTSLLGEKFVSLAPPRSNPSSELLDDGDTIKLASTGRNVEVEEVLGALSLLLNGGGVAQLKTITTELNSALEGREGTVKSVLAQLRTFMAQVDDGKAEIVTALERVNSLAISLNKRTDDLDLALEELPSAIASVDRQRNDLIKMLRALSELSAVGTQVIEASKADTITSLNALAPTLTELAKSGDDLVNSLQIILTYPFMDAIVGKTPAQARDLHMGDFTNLSIDLQLDAGQLLEDGIGIPGGPTIRPCDVLPNPQVGDLCRDATGQIIRLTERLLDQLLGGGGGGGGGGGLPGLPDLPDLGGRGGGGGQGGGQGGGGGGVLGDILGRAPVGNQAGSDRAAAVKPGDVDTDLAAMLVWGVLER